jgi:uridylate kinase
MQPKYKRILLKLSGEVLKGTSSACHDDAILSDVAQRLTALVKQGVQVGVVLGGGNIFRGLTGAQNGTNRVLGDTMGMLATIINALAVQNALERIGTAATVMTAQQMPQIAPPFNARQAIALLEQGTVVIFAGGTGNPFFSTDSGAALRAAEIEAGERKITHGSIGRVFKRIRNTFRRDGKSLSPDLGACFGNRLRNMIFYCFHFSDNSFCCKSTVVYSNSHFIIHQNKEERNRIFIFLRVFG